MKKFFHLNLKNQVLVLFDLRDLCKLWQVAHSQLKQYVFLCMIDTIVIVAIDVTNAIVVAYIPSLPSLLILLFALPRALVVGVVAVRLILVL